MYDIIVSRPVYFVMSVIANIATKYFLGKETFVGFSDDLQNALLLL